MEYILLTHGHYDHTTGVPDLKKRFPDAQVYIHQADANGAGSTLYPLAGQVAGLKHYKEGGQSHPGFPHHPGDGDPGPLPRLRHPAGGGTCSLPGTPCSAAPAGRTDLRGGSYEQIMASLKRLGELEGNFHVCPGHDRTSTLEQERRYNPFLMEAMRG